MMLLYIKKDERYLDDGDGLVARVSQMEQYYDIVRDEVNKLQLYEKAEITEMIQILKSYQESGQWLKDFESDERGKLPADLKRGVLSEDGLYNLLCEVECSFKDKCL